ncbi:MAG: NACHT domain-containing protein [Anaerolineaceae bacterium]|nr:NACHT domain-containing protein [Anaerolineaceae bacterium]
MWAQEAEKPIISILVKGKQGEIAAKYHAFYDTVHAVQYIPPDEASAWQRYHLHLRTVYREFDRAIHFATQAVTFMDIPTEQKEEYIQPEADTIFIRMVETPGKNETCSLEDAWVQYSGRVLLLGDPGAGKTTMLLHHAQSLIAAYVRDPNQRMPFYASITQWDSSNRELADGTIQEGRPLAEWFAQKYNLPPAITRYIEHGEAVLILDGLDELGNSRPINPQNPEEGTYDPRQRFMAQVQWAVDRGNDVLITCRVKDYEAVGELFAEMGAVQLHHLNDNQIRTYLNGFPTVQTAVMDDAGLLDICRSPLLLRLIAFGYRDAPADLQSLGSLKEGALRDEIFGRYIDQLRLRSAAV